MSSYRDKPPAVKAPPRSWLGVFRYSRRALELVWTTNHFLTIVLAALTLVAGVLPAAIAWVGALIIDAVLAATRNYQAGLALSEVLRPVLSLVALEALVVATIAGAGHIPHATHPDQWVATLLAFHHTIATSAHGAPR